MSVMPTEVSCQDELTTSTHFELPKIPGEGQETTK